MMEAHHIRRLPVLDNGRLVGMVSRADLLGALTRLPPREVRPNSDDEQIRRCVHAQIDQQPWAPRACIRITVHDGVVELAGSITHEAARTPLRVLAESTAGVKRVIDQLVWIEPVSGTMVKFPKVVIDDPIPMAAAEAVSVKVSPARAVTGRTNALPKCPDWNCSAH